MQPPILLLLYVGMRIDILCNYYDTFSPAQSGLPSSLKLCQNTEPSLNSSKTINIDNNLHTKSPYCTPILIALGTICVIEIKVSISIFSRDTYILHKWTSYFSVRHTFSKKDSKSLNRKVSHNLLKIIFKFDAPIYIFSSQIKILIYLNAYFPSLLCRSNLHHQQ